MKDGTRSFDDYFPCIKCSRRLEHVMDWRDLSIYAHNRMIVEGCSIQQSRLAAFQVQIGDDELKRYFVMSITF
jgi:hypothetical protein